VTAWLPPAVVGLDSPPAEFRSSHLNSAAAGRNSWAVLRAVADDALLETQVGAHVAEEAAFTREKRTVTTDGPIGDSGLSPGDHRRMTLDLVARGLTVRD
jgi:hypothetical protein